MGPSASYYASGGVKTQGVYINGTEDGLRITRFEKGGVLKEEPVQAGVIQGVVKEYYASGRLKAQTGFYAMPGRRHAHGVL